MYMIVTCSVTGTWNQQRHLPQQVYRNIYALLLFLHVIHFTMLLHPNFKLSVLIINESVLTSVSLFRRELTVLRSF